MTLLSAADTAILTRVIKFLADPSPFFITSPPAPRVGIDVLTVAGNWYDGPHKAIALARAAEHRPTATILLTGGRNERLTPPEAVALGGEPMLLQSILSGPIHNISRSRMVIYTGSRITNHNLQAMLMFATTSHRFERRSLSMQLFEEAFLVRREAAALSVLLKRDEAATRAISSLRVRPVGARSFEQLVTTHGGHEDVALALVLGEVERLRQYSNATLQGGSGELTLPAEAAFMPGLESEVDRLLVQHRELLRSGRALLADRQRLFSSGAAPRSVSFFE